jgi:hypothetical protein
MSWHIGRDALKATIGKKAMLQHEAKMRLARAVHEEHNRS